LFDEDNICIVVNLRPSPPVHCLMKIIFFIVVNLRPSPPVHCLMKIIFSIVVNLRPSPPVHGLGLRFTTIQILSSSNNELVGLALDLLQ
jgi:hypothetical protein